MEPINYFFSTPPNQTNLLATSNSSSVHMQIDFAACANERKADLPPPAFAPGEEIILAFKKGDIKKAALLIAKGESVASCERYLNNVDFLGRNLLHYLSETLFIDEITQAAVIKKLLLFDVKIICDKELKTPLHLAIMKRYSVIAKSLIFYMDKDAINKQEKYGATALYLATFYKIPEIVCLLLKKGANRHLKISDGWTPYLLAKARHPKEVLPCFSLLTKGEILYEEELIQRKVLSANWNIKGKSYWIDSKCYTDYGGGFQYFAIEKIYTKSKQMLSNQIFLNDMDQKEQREMLLSMIPVLECALKSFSQTIEEIKTNIYSGATVMLASGWRSHAVTLVIKKPYLLICNRGEANGDVPIVAFKVNIDKLTKDDLEKVIQIENLSNEEGPNYLYRDLIKKLDGTVDDLFCQMFYHLVKLPPQERGVGNCWWISPLTAVLAILLINTISKREKVSVDICKRCYSESFRFFQFFKNYLKLSFFNDYLSTVNKKSFFSRCYDISLIKKIIKIIEENKIFLFKDLIENINTFKTSFKG